MSFAPSQKSSSKNPKNDEYDEYCIDIIQQNLAAIGILKSANLRILKRHVNNCVKTAAENKDFKKINEITEEIIRVVEIAQSK